MNRRIFLLVGILIGPFIPPVLAAPVAGVTSGDGHYFVLSDQGVLESWGRNDFGQLGQGTLQST